ncbi:MAG: fibrobacter succinogenes major paralogous domain-containing protein [Bacteroidetes bacterium]|nr:fibrobacter succinogenes major paralogous domain-containing protein [Bacteroidota bacterium]
MKTTTVITTLAILLVSLILAAGCKKKNEDSVVTGPVPVVVTVNHSNLLLSTVHFSGSITSDGGVFVTKRGFCWSSANQNPTIQNDSMVFGNGAGSFNGTLTGLKGQTNYYVRAFATNSNGTGYGSIMGITTMDTTIADVDDNHYRIVQIGTQVWMAENLKTTKYSDGTSIPLVTDATAWTNLTTPGYCWYNNLPAFNKKTYGALYNWYAVNTGKLAPAGWHVPTDGEWTVLTDFLGGEDIAGGKMKEAGTAHWLSPNTGATNESGFTAVPAGFRSDYGTFWDVGNYGYWWSSSGSSTGDAWYRRLVYDYSYVYRTNYGKSLGFSGRCLRDF